ncbi:unnamed protein product [Owenia fusiformis]|nr:unnamed protein product [Owenia fusiformis]
MLEANLDENDPECRVPPSNLRLGAIGAGTGNGVAVISTGVLNTDNGVTSNAIYISLGVSSLSMDTNHIFCNKKLVCRQLLMSGYGFYGDVFYDSEQARWAGTKRYIYAVLKNLIRHRTHETEISYLPHDSPEGGDWVTIQGRYKGILQFNFIFNPGNGREEFESSLQNGFMYIYCLKECSRWQHLLRWKRWIDSIRFKQGYTLHEPYEDLYIAKAFRIKAIGPDASLPINSRASFDGEFHQLEKSEFEVRVQRRSVKLFGVLHKDPPKDGTPV